MQKAILILITIVFTNTSLAQSYDYKRDAVVIDVSENIVSRYTVAKDLTKHIYFPSAVQLSNSNDEMLTAYIETAETKRIMFANGLLEGTLWQTSHNANNWTSTNYRSLSMFKLGRATIRRSTEPNIHTKGNLLLFIGGNPLLVSSSISNGESWSELYPANSYGAYRVSGLAPLKDGGIMALFSDDGRFVFGKEDSLTLRKSAIYKTISLDGGLTWAPPEIALKHNIYGLDDAVIFRSPGSKKNELVMITSERETNMALISFSYNEGYTWSYPVVLPKFIQGDRFSVTTYHGKLYIAFRDMCRTLNNGVANPTFGDLMLWTGDLRELIKEHKVGLKIRIADNYPSKTTTDLNDLRVYDSGYPSLIPLSNHRLSIIAYGRWEKENPPYIVNFIVDTKALKKLRRKY